MENEEVGFISLANFGSAILLKAIQQLWLQPDIAWFVDTMDVSESSSNGELLRNRGQGCPNSVNILRCRIQLVRRDATVVNTILHTSSYSNFHLEDQVHGCHLLEVLCA